MMNSTLYSPEYIREMAMGGFERAIQGLKAHGGEVEELAEVVDAAFLLWQLAGSPNRRSASICRWWLILFMEVKWRDRFEGRIDGFSRPFIRSALHRYGLLHRNLLILVLRRAH